MTHPSLSWKMITFPLHLKPAFALVWARGHGLWLIVKPSIHSFRIVHFTFTSALHFCFNLIQPSTFSLFKCECGHGLDASNTHLTCCPFGGR
jgi:hypothetical protein